MLFELSKILDAIKHDDLPELTVEKAKTTILNFFATGLAAANSPVTKAERAIWSSMRGSGDSVILGHSGRVAPIAAASVNALMGQTYLLEDCHEHTLSHPGVVSIPVALALGQSMNASGMNVIKAVVAGYEAMGRIGGVLIAPGFPVFGLRPASILAPFGGTAAAAMILNLDTEGVCAALSIAANTASGVMEFVNTGAGDICIQNSFAAKNSVMAALLASEGVAGSVTILDGRFGLGRAMNRSELDWSRALRDTRGHYMIDESFIKRYPGCGHVLATAQAAASIAAKCKIEPGEVESVTVGVCKGAVEFPGVDNRGPFSGAISAMMSHQFMVASVLVHGEVSARTVDMFDHPEVEDTARKVYVKVDEQVDKAFPEKTGARLSIRMKNGDVFNDFQEDLKPLDREEVIARLKTNAERIFPEGRINEIVEKTLNIGELSKIGELMRLLEI